MKTLFEYILLVFGSIIVAIGLELILAPNGLVKNVIITTKSVSALLTSERHWKAFDRSRSLASEKD